MAAGRSRPAPSPRGESGAGIRARSPSTRRTSCHRAGPPTSRSEARSASGHLTRAGQLHCQPHQLHRRHPRPHRQAHRYAGHVGKRQPPLHARLRRRRHRRVGARGPGRRHDPRAANLGHADRRRRPRARTARRPGLGRRPGADQGPQQLPDRREPTRSTGRLLAGPLGPDPRPSGGVVAEPIGGSGAGHDAGPPRRRRPTHRRTTRHGRRSRRTQPAGRAGRSAGHGQVVDEGHRPGSSSRPGSSTRPPTTSHPAPAKGSPSCSSTSCRKTTRRRASESASNGRYATTPSSTPTKAKP